MNGTLLTLGAAGALALGALAQRGSRDIEADPARTPAFRRWFGDSRVVDADGAPLVVYHATTYGDFDTFDKAEQRKGMAGYGFYFSDREGSNLYADHGMVFQSERSWNGKGKRVNIMPVYLRMANPLVVEDIAEVKARYGRRDPGALAWGARTPAWRSTRSPPSSATGTMA